MIAIQVFASMVLFISFNNAIVPLYNAEDENFSDEREFILVQKRPQEHAEGGTSNSTTNDSVVSSVRAFSDEIEHRHGVQILKHFTIRRWRAVLIRGTKTQVDTLRQDHDLEYIASNMQVNAFTSPRKLIKTFYNYNKILKNTETDTDSSQNDTDTPIVCYQQIPGTYLWHLSRISSHKKPNYKNSPYLFTDVDMGAGVDIYVVDTGVRITHRELRGRAVAGFKATDIDEPNDDLNGHGTNVASLAAGESVGSSKEAQVVSVKVLDAEGVGVVSWIMEGMQWISERISAESRQNQRPKAVISLSLGISGVSYALDDVINSIVQDIEVTLVSAAGNDHADACYSSPGRLSTVITVGAATSSDTLASFSNYGPCVDILAPGQSVIGAWTGGDNFYAEVSGTSQATPIVSGIVARYLSSLDNDRVPTPNFVKAYLTDTSSMGYVVLSGSGERTTPNRLVYRACESLGPDLPSYSLPYPGSNSASPFRTSLISVLMTYVVLLYSFHIFL